MVNNTKLVLITVATLGFSATLGLAPVRAADDTSRSADATQEYAMLPTQSVRGLNGTWLVQGNPAPDCGVAPFVNLTSIDRTGSVTNVDPNVATAVGQAFRLSYNSYSVSFFGFADPGTIYAVHALVGLDNVNQLSGTFDATISDTAGNALCHYSGTIAGERLIQ